MIDILKIKPILIKMCLTYFVGTHIIEFYKSQLPTIYKTIYDEKR